MYVLQAVNTSMRCACIGDFIVCGLVGDLVLCASRRFSICHAGGTSLTHETRPTLYRTPLFVFIHCLCGGFAVSGICECGLPPQGLPRRRQAST